jgi:hypothetical protein
MYDFIASLHPITTQTQLDAILAKAKEDDHCCLSPTHFIQKGGQIVGHVSIGVGSMPFVMSHFSKLDMVAEDTATILNIIENTLSLIGAKGYYTMVPQDSPNYVTINHPKTGFKNLGQGNLFVKEF